MKVHDACFPPSVGGRWLAWLRLWVDARFYAVRDGVWQPDGDPVRVGSVRSEVSPDGRLLETVGGRSADRLAGWDLTRTPPTLKWAVPLGDRPGPGRLGLTTAFWFSADGRTLAFPSRQGAGDEFVVWRNLPDAPEAAATIPLPVATGLDHYRAALSPKGRRLAYTKYHLDEVVVEDLSGRRAREAARFKNYPAFRYPPRRARPGRRWRPRCKATTRPSSIPAT